ncbi:hypothetical protein KDK95_17645 [Actinospica sp. MGRD01-02]|uniref:Uncharacterized protein n=1 Tax=Actinospica acidithermotolerans TaxID=2828514 RepID=A0A941ED09_9ACTN|nr:hypothetical protein [Actinospica acidithermotolerans]MBR7828145.1 hypothetical protein [Actinospica acidithermotolerans]
MTELEFTRALRDAAGERDSRLWLGDVFGRMPSAEMREDAHRLGKSLRSAQEYAHTSRMCTPPVRERISASPVLVSYTVLRIGARANRLKVPYDESYHTLLRMIEEAEASGVAQITPTAYQMAIGLGPRLEDLFGPDGSEEGFLAHLEETAPGPDREQFFSYLAAQQRENAERDRAIADVVSAKRAKQREWREREEGRLGLAPDRAVAEETAFARAVCAIDESIRALNARFGHLISADLEDERNRTAVTLAHASIAMFAKRLGARIAPNAEPAVLIPAQHDGRLDEVAA